MLAIGTLLAANFATAQSTNPVKFGLKAGVNVANLTGSTVNDNTARFGGYGGAFANIPISSKLSIQPEVLYSLQGTRWNSNTLDFYGTNIDQEVEQNINLEYANLPVMLKYEFGQGFYAEIGPQIGLILAATDKNTTSSVDKNIPSAHVIVSNTTDTNIKSSLKEVEFSGALGGGFKFKNGLSIDARYIIGFQDIDKSNIAQAKNSVFSLGLGYTFK